MFDKLPPYFRQPLLSRLAVSNPYARVGNHFLQFCRAQIYAVYTVMDIVRLTAAAKLLCYSLRDDSLVVLDNIGLDGVSVYGRLFDNAHVSDTAHRHIEGAWYGRCGKGENVHARKCLLEPLFVGDTEPLLLVDYCKPEAFKLNVLLDKPVSADYHVYFAVFELL